MNKVVPFLTCVLFLLSCQKFPNRSENINVDLITQFEKTPNKTVTYEQGIAYWKIMDNRFNRLKMVSFGTTDIGKPLHWIIISNNQFTNLEDLALSEKPLLLINNAIHAGEPCGVDASMLFARELLLDEGSTILENINVVIIPFYNIGGVLNRNSTTRANQNGPEEYGFRGNAKNLDLNRDFLKADSKNAKWFAKGYSLINPDVFIDNHTTNGADYQHVITLISSMPEHYEEPLRSLHQIELDDHLFFQMEENEIPMSPYVYTIGDTPLEGIRQFNDLPRYSMGYASLHNSLAFTPEAHMLKTYKERVHATLQLMHIMANWIEKNGHDLVTKREEANKRLLANPYYTLKWEIDTTVVKHINFLGYSPDYKTSKVTGQDRLFYDRSKPIETTIPYYFKHKESLTIKKPKAYIISQAYSAVIERLTSHGVEVEYLKKDEEKEVVAYRILDYDTGAQPYEFHYLHSNVEVEPYIVKKQFYKGDIIIPMSQEKQKIILECLEPQAEDSFFAWNFFDGVLQQKEYFSPYLFEDEAAQLLADNPDWREELADKKEKDSDFANNAWEQLYFIYKKSERYEKTHNVYPVYRIE